MTDEDAPISIPPLQRIEDLFVGLLQESTELADLTIVPASNRDSLVPPLHCFVQCIGVTPVMSFGQNYRADVQIAVVTNIDDQLDAERKAWLTKVLRALTNRDKPFTIGANATLFAWPLVSITEASSDQQTADVIRVTAAAVVAG